MKINSKIARPTSIVYNAPESTAGAIEERKSDDKAFILEACNSFCDGSIPPTDILLARRLGKHKEDNTSRPLLIKVKSETTKRTIFGQLHKLRNNNEFPDLSMNHDMTRDEKEKTKLLVEKAKQQTKEIVEKSKTDENSKNWVSSVRGPPWNQEIRKVRLRPSY